MQGKSERIDHNIRNDGRQIRNKVLLVYTYIVIAISLLKYLANTVW